MNRRNFLLQLKILPLHRPISEYDSVTKVPGFKWDHSEWINPEKENRHFGFTTLWDPKTERLSKKVFQSGIGFKQDLMLRRIFKEPSNPKQWKTGVSSGYYFFNDESEYLFSSQGVVARPTIFDFASLFTGITNQLVIGLPTQVRSGRPIKSLQFVYNGQRDRIDIETEWRYVSKFSGKIINGAEQETELDEEFFPDNFDTTKKEFVLRAYSPKDQKRIFNLYYNLDLLQNAETASVDGYYSLKFPLTGYDGQLLSTDLLSYSLDQKDIFLSDSLSIESNTLYLNLTIPLETSLSSFDFGSIAIKQKFYWFAIFNQNPEEEYTELLGYGTGDSEQVFQISEFPLKDIHYENGVLDVTSTQILVASGSGSETWVRVDDLTVSPSEYLTKSYYTEEQKVLIQQGKVYVLDSYLGLVYFNNAGGATVPEDGSTVSLIGTKFPYLIYEPFVQAKEVFYDYDLNINPVFKTTRGHFLMLSDSLMNPKRITLELVKVSDPTYNLARYNFITYSDNDIYLVATVYGKNNDPIPDQEVTFYNLDSKGNIVPSVAVTDIYGKAYVRYFPPFSFEDYGIKIPLFNEANPADFATEAEAIAATPAILFSKGYQNDPRLAANQLIVPSGIISLDSDLSAIYLFATYSDDELQPYNAITREGGRNVVWYTGSAGNEILISPNSVAVYTTDDDGNPTEFLLTFDINLPESYPPTIGIYENIQAYVIIAPLSVRFKATTEDIYGITLESNTVKANVELPATMKGVWTLPDPENNSWDGSAISTATYIKIVS